MSEAGLPPVDGLVLAEAVDALPARLRKRLDDTVAKAQGWPVSASGDSAVVVTVDESTTVTLTMDAGAVRTGDGAVCSCLLAPNCLHRAAVLSCAPVAEVAELAATAPESEVESFTEPAAAADLTAGQRAAADALWRQGVSVLAAGVQGAGVVTEAGLYRAAHAARAEGLHRIAATTRRVAAGLRSAREQHAAYRLPVMTDDLGELLALSRQLCDPALPADLAPDLVGTARRGYELHGSLRLSGLCSVPVVARSGHAGTVTYVVAKDSTIWAIADLYPGGADRALTAPHATVALGEAALSHRALTRAGLVVSGATASAHRQLGAGKSVKAVRASGASWTAEPLAGLWAEPVAAQAERAFASLGLPVTARPAGSDLMFLRVRLLGRGPDGLPQAATPDGLRITLTAPGTGRALPYQDNLQVLAQAPGTELLLIGQPDPASPLTLIALSVGVPDDAESTLALPAAWGGHADLGIDRLHRSHIPGYTGKGEAARGGEAEVAGEGDDAMASGESGVRGEASGEGEVEANAGGDELEPVVVRPADPALALLRRHIERITAGGRAVQALAGVDSGALRRARLETGAALLDQVTLAARDRGRDPFGRITSDSGEEFARSWLALVLYEAAAARAFAQAGWMVS
ncbi:hypothetical protein [Longispora albida]|uniref:hypothetical protein n=1 Tax=Longispora albida TaxID=203523 RepID=UPI0003A1A7B1|nr:hypothetical protein [Longispora albida]